MARGNAFSVARSITNLLSKGPISPNKESHVIVAKLRRAWLLCLKKELSGDGERCIAPWDLPAGGSLPTAGSYTAEDFLGKKYPIGFHIL